MHIWLLRWDSPFCCGRANQSVCISLPRLGDISQGQDEWLRFPQCSNGVTVWQHQQLVWPLSFTDVAVLRMRRCLFYRMVVSWPMAHSQRAQGQLSIPCWVSLASLQAATASLVAALVRQEGRWGESLLKESSNSAMPRVCTAQGSNTRAPQSFHVHMAAVD